MNGDSNSWCSRESMDDDVGECESIGKPAMVDLAFGSRPCSCCD